MLERQENHAFAATVDAVVARWTDAEFLTAMMQSQGSREIAVTVEHRSTDEIHVTITRQVPVDAPAMIRAVIGSWLDLTQNDVWTRAADGSWSAVRDAKPKGLSAEGRCLLALVPGDGGGALCSATVSVQSRAPMVAAMVENLMLEDSTKLLRQEFAAVDAASS